jgi:exonuclease SbcD
MLDDLLGQLGSDAYSALIIAGDVYDRSIPSPESVTLLGSFFSKLRRALPNLPIMLIPGNHDSPDRLGYARELFLELGIHIGSAPDRLDEPIRIGDGPDRCDVFLLPFLGAGSLEVAGDGGNGDGAAGAGAAASLRSQAELAKEAARRLELARNRSLDSGARWTVLAAHLFALGGADSESERSFLGTAERVGAELFSRFDYVALGHLHRCQRVSDNCWYAGSPLAYSFDEADQEKAFLSVELHGPDGSGSAATVRKLPIQPLRKVVRIAGGFDELMADTPAPDRVLQDPYVEITLTDDSIVENPLALLRRAYPNLLSVRQEHALSAAGKSLPGQEEGQGRILEKRGIDEEFDAFLKELYGSSDADERELFRDLAKEAEHAPQ